LKIQPTEKDTQTKLTAVYVWNTAINIIYFFSVETSPLCCIELYYRQYIVKHNSNLTLLGRCHHTCKKYTNAECAVENSL